MLYWRTTQCYSETSRGFVFYPGAARSAATRLLTIIQRGNRKRVGLRRAAVGFGLNPWIKIQILRKMFLKSSFTNWSCMHVCIVQFN